MFADLSINLAASVIYDFGKAILSAANKTEAVQLARKQLGAAQHLHDFPDRYLEALVELRFEQKPKIVLDFFRAEAIMQAFYGYYYGPLDLRGDEKAHTTNLNQCTVFLRQKYPDTPTGIDISAEVQYFWQVFRQKVQESRTVKEVEINQKLDELKSTTSNATTLLQQLNDWLRQKNAGQIEIEGNVLPIESAQAQRALTQKADKIYNIGNIGTAVFGGIHYHHGDKKIPRHLTAPPFNTELFLGRANDLNAIEADYQQNNRLLVLVNGEGGIGKTTLAAKYWYAHETRYQHLAWLYADAGIGSALVTLKEKLGVAFAPEDTLEIQVQRMAEALSNLQAPCLLVFDNANNEADLKQHYALLNRLSNCHILLTSRVRKVANMKTHAVKPLTPEEAVELFKTHYLDLTEAELPLLRDVLQAVGHNTLVTEVLAKNLAALNRFALRHTLADLLRDLQAQGLLALKNKTVAVIYGSDTLREAQPTDIIAAMYDLAQLNDAERHLLSNLSALPAENIPYSLLAALLGAEEDALEAPLGTLETKGWIEYRKSDNSFKISPVIQEVTKAKNAERLLGDCRMLVNTILTGLNSDNRHTDNYQPAAVFARLGAAVVQALPVPDLDLVILCQNIGWYHQDTGNLSGMMQYYQKMLDIQTALCAAEPDNADFKNVLAISYEKLGSTHTALGNLTQALTFFENYNQLEKELHDAFPQNVAFKNVLAISYSKLGETHTDLGNLTQALTFFEKDIELSKELHDAFPQNVEFKNGLAISYEKLGSTHTDLGNLTQALTFFENYNQLEKELHDAFPQNVAFKNNLAISYEKLGSTHTALGNLTQALTFFENYNQLEKELHDAFPQNVAFKNVLAISYQYLGNTHTALGNLTQALTFFENYNQLEKELHDAYPQNVAFKNGLAISYSKLGETHTALGNLTQALTFFENYNQLEKELHDAFPQNVEFKNVLAISYLMLGQFYIKNQNEPEKAKPYIQQGYDLYVELVRDFPDYQEFKRNYEWAKQQLGY